MSAHVSFSSMAQVLIRRRLFRRLWLSDVVSHLGDWLSMVALAVLITREAQSGVALGILFTIHTLPHVFSAPFAGRLADSMNRKTIMVASHLSRGVVTLAMVSLAATGHLVWLQVLLLLRMVMSSFFEPAARASLPRLVDDDELVTANALQGLSWSVLFAVGMAAGGLLSSTLGPVGALFIDGLTFFVAALLLRGLPAIHPISDADDDDDKEDSQGENTDDLESPAKNKKQESFFSAFHVARKNPLLWRALWAKTPLAIVGGVFWVVLNLEAARTSFVDVGWHRFAFDGALTYGLFQSIRGIGTGVGPVALRRFQGSRRVWLDVTSFVFGILFLWTVSGQGALSMWGIGAVMLLWGMVLGHNWVESSTALSLCADDQWRGRLSAWDWMLMSAGQSFSALAGGFLLDYFSKEVALGAFIGLGFFCWLSTGALSLFHKKQ